MTLAAIGAFVFNTRAGQALAAALGVALLFGMWLHRHDAKVAERATTAIVKKSEETGKANEKASDAAHVAASKPGAAERLRKHCRDC